MSSGDAYVYCLIISPESAQRINEILSVIMGKEKIVDEIIKEITEDNLQLPERGKRGIALLDEIKHCKKVIREFCKNPIAIYHVADDSCIESYHACDEAIYVPTSVDCFLEQTKGKIWAIDQLLEKHKNQVCICLPSHYDCDDELLEELGVNRRSFEDYNNHRHTEPIERTKYVLVDLRTGKIIWCDTLQFVAYEWARSWYEFGNTDNEVREVHIQEVRTLSKVELDKVVDETFGDETQYGITWHVDKHEEGKD